MGADARYDMLRSKAALGRLTFALMAIGFAVLLALGGGLVWLVQQTRVYAGSVASTQELRLSLVQILNMLQDAETGQRGYLLTGEASYLEPYQAALPPLEAALPDLVARVVADGGQAELPRRFVGLAEAKIEEMRRTLGLAEDGQREAALALVRGGEGRRLMDDIRTTGEAMQARSAARLAARTGQLDEAGEALLLAAGTALPLLALVALGTVVATWRHLREIEAARAAATTANAELEARVAERTASLAAANEEIQRFAYIVSHDLRAPLVNVMGFTAELEAALGALRDALARAEAADPALVGPAAREAVDADIPEALGFIRSSTERMDRLIAAILRLSREGRRTLAPERLQPEEIVARIADSLRHQLDAAAATLTVEGRLPMLVTDRLALEQVLGNLLDNAVKYLDPARPGRIVLRGRAQGGRAEIEVEDNGRGIDPRDHARIFELFRRSGPQDRPGEGVGLAHVRTLVRRLGGDIACSSERGKGSVFRVTLPLVTPAARLPLPGDPVA